MAIMLPNELIWIMDKLGYDWPDFNEDDLLQGGLLTMRLHSDLESIVHTAHNQITQEIPATATGKAALAYSAAWEANRAQNLEPFLHLLVPVPMAMDIAAVTVVGLKTKVIAQVSFDLGTMIPLIAAGPLGAAAFIAKKAASKIVFNIATDYAVGKLVEAVAPIVIEPLAEFLPAKLEQMLAAPEVEDTGADPGKLHLDPQVMKEIESTMDLCAADIEQTVGEYVTAMKHLTFTE